MPRSLVAVYEPSMIGFLFNTGYANLNVFLLDESYGTCPP